MCAPPIKKADFFNCGGYDNFVYSIMLNRLFKNNTLVSDTFEKKSFSYGPNELIYSSLLK